MRNYALRAIIAIVGFLLFIYVCPLVFSVLGLPISGDAFQLIKVLAGIVALGYIVWGPNPPF